MAEPIDTVRQTISNPRENMVIRNVENALLRLLSKNITRLPLIYLTILIFVAIFGEQLAPYGYDERIYQDGEALIAAQPSMDHPLGTTDAGYDVLSRVLVGAQPTVLAGFLGGVMIIGIGLTIALLSGYLGGYVDNTLMRLTDLVYSIPLIPFAVVVLAFFGGGFYVSIAIIGLLLWRGNARVIRSQVLQIKERNYITAAKATGASSTRIITKHIFPNVAPMATLYFALGIGYSIIAQASLAFIGVANPFQPAWGVIIRNAYNSGYMAEIWTWSIVPGVLISLTVLSCFLIGREFEMDNSDAPGGAQ